MSKCFVCNHTIKDKYFLMKNDKGKTVCVCPECRKDWNKYTLRLREEISYIPGEMIKE